MLTALLLVLSAAPADPEPESISSRWSTSFYGFLELDVIGDSTQSFNEAPGNGAIARPDTYAGSHGRLMFSARNTRFGFKIAAPELQGLKVSADLEMDFLGVQPLNSTEAATFTHAMFRLRNAWVMLQTPYADVLIGQTWQLFAWMPSSFPNTLDIQPMPGQAYGRAPQLRVSRLFTALPLSVEVAIAASRPAQRDSMVPDVQAGARLRVDGWKGVHTLGAAITSADPLSAGVSGIARRFVVPELSPAPKADLSAMGWGASVDVFIPILRASMDRRANALTFTGSYVRGDGIADLLAGVTGGVSFPSTYSPGIDQGLVGFDAGGNLRPVAWQAVIAGLQYYLPPSGNVWVSANYSQVSSANAQELGAADKIFTRTRWADANLFWDLTPALRAGVEYAWFDEVYADGVRAQDHRIQGSAFFLF